MQPYETMAITVHHRLSNAGSVLQAAIYILQQNRVNVTAGFIMPGPLLERFDAEHMLLKEIAELVCYKTNHMLQPDSPANTWTWDIDLAGRLHFGHAAEISAWRSANQVIFAMDCAWCNGAGCLKCNDLGKVYRTA